MKELIKDIIRKARLKYNYFSINHPNKSLQGKLFKFLDDNKVQLLKTKKTIQVKKEDLERGSKKLYSPADMG